jgi:hypothetical protein
MFGSMANQSCLIYLNNPETLTKTGVLHKKTFQNNNRVRYFFHYKNGTDKPQKFVFSCKGLVYNLKKSVTTHKSPEMVGAYTARNFLKSKEINSQVNLVSWVEPNTTISGILEANFSKGSVVTCYFGNKDQSLARTVTIPYFSNTSQNCSGLHETLHYLYESLHNSSKTQQHS